VVAVVASAVTSSLSEGTDSKFILLISTDGSYSSSTQVDVVGGGSG